MPKILTEKSNSLSYIKEDLGEGKHYLGKLAGVGAEFNKPTRNGRRYPLELWRNIEKSDDFKEGMQTHTIFGECDHPETRVETSIKEIAIVLTKYEIREKEGNVYTEFHILDTPNGRILKELLDYGSQIGVSTRGLGDEIERDGEIIIDPDTYCFYGWDAVVMPAVKNARPEVVESKKASLIESFNNEIKSASTIDELNSIKRVVSKMPELDSIKESINIKLKSMEAGDDISAKLEADLGSISEENLRLQEQISKLEEKIAANNIRAERSKLIIESYRNVNKALRNRLTNYAPYARRLENKFGDSVAECEGLDKETTSLRENLKRTDRQLKESKKRYREIQRKLQETKQQSQNSKRKLTESIERSESLTQLVENLRSDVKSAIRNNENLQKEVNRLKSEINSKELIESKLNRALQENKKLKEQITNNKKQLEEEKQRSVNTISKYKEKVVENNSTIADTLERYIQVKCAQNGIKVETVNGLLPERYNTKDIDRIVDDLANRKMRYDALPFSALPSNPTRIVESDARLSPEDKQTVAFLQNFK